MKNQRGVTIASLTIYIIVSAVIVVLLAFITSNFMGQISELTDVAKVSEQFDKFNTFFIMDVKSNDTILEYSEKEIVFKNGVRYECRANATSGDRVVNYNIYRNDIEISSGGIEFGYEDGNVVVKYIDITTPEYAVLKTQNYKLGRGY